MRVMLPPQLRSPVITSRFGCAHAETSIVSARPTSTDPPPWFSSDHVSFMDRKAAEDRMVETPSLSLIAMFHATVRSEPTPVVLLVGHRLVVVTAVQDHPYPTAAPSVVVVRRDVRVPGREVADVLERLRHPARVRTKLCVGVGVLVLVLRLLHQVRRLRQRQARGVQLGYQAVDLPA